MLVDDNDNGVAAEQCRSSFFDMETPFTRHCGTRIFPMKWGGSHWHHDFDDDEAWKVWKAVGLHG